MNTRIAAHRVGAATLTLILIACGESNTGGTPVDGAVADGATTGADGVLAAADTAQTSPDGAFTPATDGSSGSDTPPGACVPEGERSHQVLASPHVASIDGVAYSSNPPSSGPHCSATIAHRSYTSDAIAPRCNWIHNLEHGAVALLYNCPQGCPEILAQLETVIRNARDPDCRTKRFIVSPDPLLDTKVAAAAWGHTWKSSCLTDATRPDLERFVAEHMGTDGDAPEGYICP